MKQRPPQQTEIVWSGPLAYSSDILPNFAKATTALLAERGKR